MAHSLLVIAYRLIERGMDYQDLGSDYFDRRRPETIVQTLTARLARLGYSVALSPRPAAEAA